MSILITKIEEKGKDNFLFHTSEGSYFTLLRNKFEVAGDSEKIIFLLEQPVFVTRATSGGGIVRERVSVIWTDTANCTSPTSTSQDDLKTKIINLLK